MKRKRVEGNGRSQRLRDFRDLESLDRVSSKDGADNVTQKMKEGKKETE